MTMSRKDYVAAAAVIANEMLWASKETPVRRKERELAIRSIAEGLMSMFGQDNGRFDRQIFITACGLGERVTVKAVKPGETFHLYGRWVKVVAVSGPSASLVYRNGIEASCHIRELTW